ELDKLGLPYRKVQLGEVDIRGGITAEQKELFRQALLKSGLVLMDDKNTILVEKIKNVVVEIIHYGEDCTKINFSDFISEKLHLNYTYLSNLFSETTGITIEQYIIAHKIERVKELLIYDQLSLTEISYQLNYSSVAHLSNQFKKVTGLTPSFYKKLKHKKRIALEDL
ncbi:MAG: AraC family transcriptional regulator, partial [Bacteroidales bacterium]